ncbi:MAG TPA: hypothetical protein VF846_16600 [Thermoanaerobaculia bacterium]|jgi:hypothetical protein
MKTIAFLAMLLLSTACASNDGFVANEIDTCQPGDELELNAGIGEASFMGNGQATVLVEVSNNSNADVTVKNVRVDPESFDRNQFEVQGGSRAFDQEILEGESHTFEVPITFRVRDMMNAQRYRGTTASLEAALTVKLASGDAARCRFLLPVRF